MTEQTLPPHLHPLRQALSGQYSVERSLGAGGMGTVLLGRDVTLDREVAIKVISPEITVTPTLRERFLREARTVAKLRHPNIVAVYAAGEANGLLYFVMEWVPGESLSDYLQREGRCSPEMTATILRDLADALDHAHRQGVIHRDVKPDNILLDAETGRAKLTDFGVARALVAREERLTGTGLVLGTPRYMSPEQASGEESDGRSDLYSLGLVGYEMLSGAPAFGGSGPSVIMKQISERPQPIAEKVEGVPPALAAAIDRAIEKNPGDRWPDGAAMASAIDVAAAYRPPRAVAARRAPWYRRPRFAGAAAAVLALIGVTGVVIARGDAPAGDPRQSILVVPFENLTRSEEIDWLREGSVNMLTFDLSQWRELTVVGYERTLDLLRQQELLEARQIGLQQAREMAREAGVGTVITGSFEQSRDSLIVRARLYDVNSRSGEALAETRVAAARDRDPRELFDRLSHTLLALPAGGHATATAMTPSLEAYRQYLRGLTLLHSWQLDAADSAFARAIAADSTYALAYYRAALTRGWQGSLHDTSTAHYARLAARHAAGLPARERTLIEAYLLFADGSFDAAQERYRQLVATDSTDAEAWYGLGDAYYHDVPQGPGVAPQRAENWTRALRAFNRTLALDSTFHLAYAHNVEIFNWMAQPQTELVLVGDSILHLSDTAAVRAFGEARLQAARREALQRSIESARYWLFSDPDAERAYALLSTSQAAAADYAAAVATLEEAMRRPATARAIFPYRIAAYKMAQRAPDALESLRRAMRTYPADSLRREGGAMVMPTLFGAMSVAAYAGNASELQRVETLMRSLVGDLPVTVASGVPIHGRQLVETADRVLRVAMGVNPVAMRRAVDEFLNSLDALPDSTARFLRNQNQVLPQLAYLAYRDPRYKAIAEEWSGQQLPAFDALAAIERGDTAQARAIARQFRPVGASQGPLSGYLRPFAEAEALAELGEDAAAIRIYEALDGWRFNIEFADVRHPLWVRSWLARGALYERMGQRDRAIDAYRRFLELWKDADGSVAPQVSAARTALNRLGDAAR